MSTASGGSHAAARLILIHGAGGHAKVVAEIARCLGYEIVAFVEDPEERDGQMFFGAGIVSWKRFVSMPGRWRDVPVALAVGDNRGRADSSERLRSLGQPLATLVHPSAVVSPTAVIGLGTVVFPMAVVNADAVLGLGVIINTGAVVEHDGRVEDFAHLSPNSVLGGGVQVGARAHVGLGAAVLPRVRVGSDAIVGAGAVVIREVEPGATVAGVPARSLSNKSGSLLP